MFQGRVGEEGRQWWGGNRTLQGFTGRGRPWLDVSTMKVKWVKTVGWLG